MKKSLPILSPYLMLIFPIVMLLSLTLINIKTDAQNEITLAHDFSKSEQIVQAPKAASNFVKHLLKK